MSLAIDRGMSILLHTHKHKHERALAVPVGARDHSRGPHDAPLTLVEYGDFECPHCGRAYPTVEEIRRQLGDRLRFVFRNFPLREHPHAHLAAEVAEAAGAQGRFWDMHGAIFEHQYALDLRSLIGYAEVLGLDGQRIERDLERRAHRARVDEDLASGELSGVEMTPTFFINGVRFDGSWSDGGLLAALTARSFTG
jgi:protein-disulfide isomerase